MSSVPLERQKEARTIFEAARAEVDRAIPLDAVERMRTRLARSLDDRAAAAAEPRTAPHRPPWRTLATHVTVAVASFASGYAVRAATERPPVRFEVRERTVLVPAATPPDRPDAPAPQSYPSQPGPDAGSPARPRERVGTSPGLAAEQWWIDRARIDLRAGRGAEALRSAEEHSRRFPDGQLRGLREVLRAEALAAVGRRPEARALALQALRRESAPGLRARLAAIADEEGGP